MPLCVCNKRSKRVYSLELKSITAIDETFASAAIHAALGRDRFRTQEVQSYLIDAYVLLNGSTNSVFTRAAHAAQHMELGTTLVTISVLPVTAVSSRRPEIQGDVRDDVDRQCLEPWHCRRTTRPRGRAPKLD